MNIEKKKVMYTGSYKRVFVNIDAKPFPFLKHLDRNVWYSLDKQIADYLLRSPNYISEDNLTINKAIKVDDVILIKRSYALGDLIQLIPVIKFMKKRYQYKFILWTSPQFVDIMKWFKIFEDVICAKPKERYEHFLILNGVLESDHSLTNWQSRVHRIKIYEKFFKIEIDEYDFKPNEG